MDYDTWNELPELAIPIVNKVMDSEYKVDIQKIDYIVCQKKQILPYCTLANGTSYKLPVDLGMWARDLKRMLDGGANIRLNQVEMGNLGGHKYFVHIH